jgi:branched-chain amino acid transport system substrate-binding protein
MKSRTLGVLGAFAGLALAWLSCSNPREVRIAVVGPLTGDQAKTGQDILNGATLAVEEWNAKGGVRGKKVVLISADDRDDPTLAAETAYQVCRKNPLIVIGHVDSSCSIAASKIYRDRHVVMISAASTNPRLTDQGFDNVHRVCGRDDRQGKEAAVWFMKHNPSMSAAVVHDGSEYGEGLAREFQKNYEFLSNRKVLFNEPVIRGDPAMVRTVEKAKAASPDLIYFGGLYQQGAALLKNLRTAGVTSIFMAGDGCFDEEFIKEAGPDVAVGSLVTFHPDLASLPGTKTGGFMDAYQKRFGTPPGPYSLSGYTAANVGLTAASQAVAPLSDMTLDHALHRLTFETPYGLMRLDGKGDPTEYVYAVWRVEDEHFRELDS